MYLESYEFVRNQRIDCLLEGAWFPVTGQTGNVLVGKKQTTKAWRFYRLAANRKALHYCQVPERTTTVAAGITDLPEKSEFLGCLARSFVQSLTACCTVEINAITDVLPGPALAPAGKSRSRRHEAADSGYKNGDAKQTDAETTLTLTLMGTDGPLAELTAPSRSAYAEWIDGLSLLRPEGNICTRETADYVEALTEIGVKVRLLDIAAQGVTLPDVAPPPVEQWPSTTDFYYAAADLPKVLPG